MQAQRPGDILIVDSDNTFAAAACSVLAQQGHMVMNCATAQEARRHLERMPYDVVLCAWKLPGEDGASLCEYIKSAPEMPHVSVGLFVDDKASDKWVAKLFTADAEEEGGGARGMRPPDSIIPRPVGAQELNARVQGLMQLRRYRQEIDNALSVMMTMAEGAEEQDRRSRGHCKRLAIMGIELGAILGCDEWQLTALERAAYLHDVGKVAIPGAITSKTQTLTPREMEIIKSHCVLGERMCTPMAALRPVLPIIRHHHERINGSGYPDGIGGEEIPVLSQIFSIPDIYDALRMWRPFRAPMNQAQAVGIMREEVEAGFWNRHIFTAFIENVLPGLDERLEAARVLWPTL